ncbi:hypothetical protein Agub_g3274 [Astrephomene gubernaculifera]|uniref:CREG-like beta-barrel domain-containing protein n=1 Tax=Astrephomene gubernaculifera TaxID=47775 RepID=A0AAD3DID5_9CHLO|nr:hypothetical protein Agub_g3035 [Astrephomene gubernaculifera]GFR42401.1 hypothetical protein Agub_g3274 [Astrephomene gubernaculifera]
MLRCTPSLLCIMLALAAGAQAARVNLRGLSMANDEELVVGFPRPPHDQHALMARWLVHQTSWGVLSTLDRDTGEPMGGVLSHSDGSRHDASGRLFFYMSPMDELTQNIVAHANCTFTVSEDQIHTSTDPTTSTSSSSLPAYRPCAGLDPEEPPCARATLLGHLAPVPPAEQPRAQQALFARHPRMADWPADHHFTFYELHVSSLHLLSWYGGMALVEGADYYAARPEGQPQLMR